MYRKIIAIMLISLAALSLAWVLQLYAPIKIFALKGDDLQFKLFAKPERADPRIILINVDQSSLDHFEKDNIPFPWPRSLYNPIIEYSTSGGAKAVIFDILYNNDSPYGVAVDETFAAAIRTDSTATTTKRPLRKIIFALRLPWTRLLWMLYHSKTPTGPMIWLCSSFLVIQPSF